MILNKGHKTPKLKPSKYKIAQAKSCKNKENFKRRWLPPKIWCQAIYEAYHEKLPDILQECARVRSWVFLISKPADQQNPDELKILRALIDGREVVKILF